MKNRGKNVALVAAGIMLGAAITGPAASAAEMLAAQRSTQKIYVDGEQVQMEAYAIGGANYVKLRDVGKAVGFNVSWDGSAVQIESDAPYEDDTAAKQSGRIVSLPTDGSKYVPQVGDLIPCDDGTLYGKRRALPASCVGAGNALNVHADSSEYRMIPFPLRSANLSVAAAPPQSCVT